MRTLRWLHIGDVVGEIGVQTLAVGLPELKEELAADFVTANTENVHQGRGLNERQLRRVFSAGVDVQTGGDHSFDKHLIFGYLNSEERLLRPVNYPRGAPGKGFGVFNVSSLGVEVGVLNLRGNAFFNNPVQHPMDAAEFALRELSKYTSLILVDLHAEATAEKITLAWHLDGRVSAICGTHTHVQTADERVFPQGTGYLTDVGFTGPHDSVIGLDVQVSIDRLRLQIPKKTELGTANCRINAAVFEIDVASGKCLGIERLNVAVPDAKVHAALQEQAAKAE